MPRRPQAVDLPPISGLDRTSGHLGRQLTQALREAIRTGNLKPGDLLPSTRQLAGALDIARGTVMEAYEQLIAEGFLDAQSRAGTRVASALAQPRSAAGGSPKPAANATPTSLPAPAAAFAKVAEQFKPLPQVPFAVSVPTAPDAPDETCR